VFDIAMSQTEHKDLRSGRPIWAGQPIPFVRTRRLSQNMKTDVLIIGAGISGAMAAQALTEAGFDVVVVDRRGAMMGSTYATTALLQYEPDLPLMHLVKKIGKDNAIRAWQRSKLGLESLASKIQSLDIACEMARKTSLLLVGDVLDAKGLQAERDMRLEAGLPCDYLNAPELKRLYGIKRQGAIRTYNNITVQPLALTAGFLNGITVYAPHDVVRVTPHKGYVSAETQDGFSLRAKYVFFATGYEIPKHIRTRKHRVHSTWAMATAPQKRLWPEECMIWEASEPYLYIRTRPDGRVICGGEDEKHTSEDERNALLKQKTRVLERKLKTMFPHLDTKADYAWTGSFGSSTTGLPSIGSIPGMNRCMAVMAYGGNGIVFSRIAAEIIATQLRGGRDPDALLFAFQQNA
jgi:glycine/D-amino acid oxidase-like deaminating enzyme